LSIGYSVPAGTGVKCANPDKRVIVVVGDGAFHETCQAVSDQAAYGHNTVVFVLKNGIYGIEQKIVNPNPFRKPEPIQYSDDPQGKLLKKMYSYNTLPEWQFDKLTEVWGGIGRKAATTLELQTVLKEIRATPGSNFLVEIAIPETDVPNAIGKELNSSVGEDEIEAEKWPPTLF
jgi:indolepyruvate decarboxylase